MCPVSILIKVNSCPDQSIAYMSDHVELKMRMYYTHVTYVRQVKTVSKKINKNASEFFVNVIYSANSNNQTNDLIYNNLTKNQMV